MDRALRSRAFRRLARWLGPWGGRAVPPGIERRELGALRLWRGRAPPTGSVFLIAGLHPDGPDDVRFDRFARVLADAGAEVVAPSLADLRALLMTPAVFADALAAFDARPNAPHPSALMSISFASRVALHLAAERASAVRRVVMFGGYRSWQETFRFALGGALPEVGAGQDPLDGPVVLGHLADELLPGDEVAAFREAAHEFSRRTWTSATDAPGARKDDGRNLRVGAELAARLPPAAARLMRVASRIDDGALALASQAAERAAERLAFLDPSADLAHVEAPLVAIHGRDDDVIPWTHARALAAGARRGEALVTGLYGHTGHAADGPAAARPTLGARANELATMARVLLALTRVVDASAADAPLADHRLNSG